MKATRKIRSFEAKQETLKAQFSDLPSQEALYQKIMAFGKKLPPFDKADQTEEHRVKGCQSLMYLKSHFKEGRLFFFVYSDALISAGLAALLLALYNHESPEMILKCPPTFFQECGILEGLTPGRSNGLSSLYLRMKQEALASLTLIATQ